MKKTMKMPMMSTDMMDVKMDMDMGMKPPKANKKPKRPYMKSGKYMGESYERKFSAKKPKIHRGM